MFRISLLACAVCATAPLIAGAAQPARAASATLSLTATIPVKCHADALDARRLAPEAIVYTVSVFCNAPSGFILRAESLGPQAEGLRMSFDGAHARRVDGGFVLLDSDRPGRMTAPMRIQTPQGSQAPGGAVLTIAVKL